MHLYAVNCRLVPAHEFLALGTSLGILFLLWSHLLYSFGYIQANKPNIFGIDPVSQETLYVLYCSLDNHTCILGLTHKQNF